MNTYKLTLIALLAAVCVVGRLAFQMIANVQPVTSLIIISGAMLGIGPAICIALITAYVTSLFMGMGLWTVWQMLAWSVIGLVAGLIGKCTCKHQLLWLTVFSFIAAYLYGLLLNLGTYTVASGNFWSYYLAGISFDTAHAIGNVIFMIILYPILYRIFQRKRSFY
ncbi:MULTISPECIES: ECF transporter S component [Gracilibacillus]|uniref:ECF transporter S component n=1 Tax=Gracilibacillus TaxID=74385 RepID=UPI00082454F4|nr:MULTISPECIES: ECF transporter S component [Gracilibacillus]